MGRLVQLSFLAFALTGCDEAMDPPMSPRRERTHHPPAPALQAPRSATLPASSTEKRADPPALTARGELASTAAETSIYEEPRWGSKRFGYLRAGGRVLRDAEPAARGAKCPDGWYRIEPRGYVCVGPLATLDTDHPVVRATDVRPKLDGLPYLYVLSRSPPPPVYARLPTRNETLRHEPDLFKHLEGGASPGPGLPAADPTPPHLAAESPTLSLGNAWRGPKSVFVGHAKPRSGFALTATFDHLGRRFGVTPALEVIPLDRTRVVQESRFSGVELGEERGLPVAFARKAGAFRLVPSKHGLENGGVIGFRNSLFVTDEIRKVNGAKHVVARDGSFVRADQVAIAKAPKNFPAWAREGSKWIDVSLGRQTLVAYEGTRPVYATLVSTGRGGTGDPEETQATVQGMFRIYEKHVSVAMDGREASDPFDLRDVPFVQYFHESYALHATYWHDEFGRVHSHGCVNMSPIDAAWIFRWSDPHIPAGWHGVRSNTGTIVFVHS